MVITEARYTLDRDGNNVGIFCLIDGIESNIPMDADNRHYAEIMRQVAAGELTIADAE
jgi:hypothetical protein